MKFRRCRRWADGRSGLAGRYADDGDAQTVGKGEHLRLVDHDHIARGQGQAAAAVVIEILDGLGADGWDIAAAIVPGASALEQGPSARAAGFADALDHPV